MVAVTETVPTSGATRVRTPSDCRRDAAGEAERVASNAHATRACAFVYLELTLIVRSGVFFAELAALR